MSFRGLTKNLFGFITSLLIYFLLLNIFSIFFLRNFLYQKKSFPRKLLSVIPSALRWQYPDVGTSYKSTDLALIGDSYVEGAGDSFTSNNYNYSIGHFINKYSNTPVVAFGTGGSSLPEQLQLFKASLKGELWPLRNGREPIDYPSKVILFFYEGNDFFDYFEYRKFLNITKEEYQKRRLKKIKNEKYIPAFSILKNISYFIYMKYLNINKYRFKNSEETIEICSKQKCFKNLSLQDAASNITNEEILEALNSKFESIFSFKDFYNKKICLAYIPSPATIYSPKMLSYYLGLKSEDIKIDFASSEKNLNRSKFIRSKISRILEKNNIAFVDLSDEIISFSKKQYILGKEDINHFNSVGYKKIAQILIERYPECI